MTRMGKPALEALGSEGEFVPCIHSVGAPLTRGQVDVPWPSNPEKQVVHFPEQRRYVLSFNGLSLLGILVMHSVKLKKNDASHYSLSSKTRHFSISQSTSLIKDVSSARIKGCMAMYGGGFETLSPGKFTTPARE